MTEYLLSQIILDTDTFMKRIREFNLLYASLFYTQSQTGLRVGELVKENLWFINGSSTIYVQPEKKGQLRLLDISNFDTYAQDCIERSLYPFKLTSTGVANYFFKCYYPKSTIYVQDKIITTHLFRHAKIKLLAQQGLSVQEISNYMGEVDNKNTEGYINSFIMV